MKRLAPVLIEACANVVSVFGSAEQQIRANSLIRIPIR